MNYFDILSDSHLNCIFETGLCIENKRKVSIKRWPGGTTEDMIDLVKPITPALEAA